MKFDSSLSGAVEGRAHAAHRIRSASCAASTWWSCSASAASSATLRLQGGAAQILVPRALPASHLKKNSATARSKSPNFEAPPTCLFLNVLFLLFLHFFLLDFRPPLILRVIFKRFRRRDFRRCNDLRVRLIIIYKYFSFTKPQNTPTAVSRN